VLKTVPQWFDEVYDTLTEILQVEIFTTMRSIPGLLKSQAPDGSAEKTRWKLQIANYLFAAMALSGLDFVKSKNELWWFIFVSENYWSLYERSERTTETFWKRVCLFQRAIGLHITCRAIRKCMLLGQACTGTLYIDCDKNCQTIIDTLAKQAIAVNNRQGPYANIGRNQLSVT